MNSSDKVIIVTGAGAGMGREVTLELVKRGAKAVVAVDINQDALNETARLAGNNKVSTHVCDISDPQRVAALADQVTEAHVHIDGLINVAGIIHKFLPVAELSIEDIHRVFNVNFFGTVNMVKAFLPHLTSRAEAQITNISSMGSYVPVPGQTIYGASKAALKLFTEGLRSELSNTSVGVNLVFPGAIATNIATNSGAFTAEQVEAMQNDPKASKHKTLQPNVAARLIVDAFESNAFHAFAGNDAKFMYRYSRLAPEAAAKLIQKQMAELLG